MKTRLMVSSLSNRRLPLIIGLALALGTGALLLAYVLSLRPPAVATKEVLVATHYIPPRAIVNIGWFRLEKRNAGDVDPDAISDPQKVVGKYTLVAIPAGSTLTASKIGLASAATLPAELPVGMRAMSIPVDNVKAVAGLVTPGDRVDVVAVPPRVGNTPPRGYTILRGALVLAMGTNLQQQTPNQTNQLGASTAPSLSTVTLALTPSQADLVAAADLNTVLRLALRNPEEPIRAYAAEVLHYPPANTVPAATGPISAQAVAVRSAAPARAIAAGGGVTVIDGDRVTTSGTGR